MINILFICHGNICRSPMAEFVMKKLVKDRRCESLFHIESKAMHTDELGDPVYPPARRILVNHGINPDGHRARLSKRDDYDAFDYIIGMDKYNILDMNRLYGGDPSGKIHLLSEFGHFSGDVEDPWYSGNFEKVWDEINDGCAGLLEHIMS